MGAVLPGTREKAPVLSLRRRERLVEEREGGGDRGGGHMVTRSSSMLSSSTSVLKDFKPDGNCDTSIPTLIIKAIF